MGKIHVENGSGSQIQSPNGEPTTTTTTSSASSSRSFCWRCCPMGGFFTRFARCLSFNCLLVLILSLSLFISALFLLLPSPYLDSGYDASQTLKHSASVQAYFRLQTPVSQLVPRIQQLEDEINMEIGVPDTKVAILSIHKSHIPNSSYVVFCFLPHPKAVSIHSVSLSVLKSSLIELFLQESNLTLTSSTFGIPTSFEIVKFRGGITVIPRQPAPVSQIVQTLFNFTLNNSMYDVKANLDLLTRQLKTGLHLRFDENVYVQVTSKVGSTVDPPVTVQASVLSETGNLEPQRLKQLAQTIKNSSYSKNLGLNHTMFGRVRYVSLSSYLLQTIKPNPEPPSPSPEPSLPPCGALPPHTSAPASSNVGLSPRPNYAAPAPSPSPTLSPRIRSPSHPPAAQAPSAYDDISPSFHPFPFQHHMFMQGQEKSSSDSLVPRRTLRSGTNLGIHLLVSVVVSLVLLLRL